MAILSLQRLYPFEALAEIFDFVAGLVQRVPKKASTAKLDLQNSTASQGDCSWEGFSCRAYPAMEAKCFRYKDPPTTWSS